MMDFERMWKEAVVVYIFFILAGVAEVIRTLFKTCKLQMVWRTQSEPADQLSMTYCNEGPLAVTCQYRLLCKAGRGRESKAFCLRQFSEVNGGRHPSAFCRGGWFM